MKKIHFLIVLVIVICIGFVSYMAFSYKKVLEISKEDKIENWQINNVYANNPDLEQKNIDEIKRLKSMIGKGEYPDYEIYISIANQYHLLGNGKKEYEYLNRALKIDSEKTGLAWYNMGVLMEKLGALNTAKIAYKKAYESQVTVQYVTAYNDFVKRNFPNDDIIDMNGVQDQSSEFFD